jgi:hypothetical protein
LTEMMAEEKNPIESVEAAVESVKDEVREINADAQRPYDYPPGQADELEQRLEEDPKEPTGLDELALQGAPIRCPCLCTRRCSARSPC